MGRHSFGAAIGVWVVARAASTSAPPRQSNPDRQMNAARRRRPPSRGGTTHPFLTLQLLTNGSYDAEAGQFICSIGTKHYVATDHLEGEGFSTLTSEDLLDLVEKEGLRWDPASETGVVFHMISALPATGRIGLTAIGNSAAEADELNALADRILSEAARG